MGEFVRCNYRSARQLIKRNSIKLFRPRERAFAANKREKCSAWCELARALAFPARKSTSPPFFQPPSSHAASIIPRRFNWRVVCPVRIFFRHSNEETWMDGKTSGFVVIFSRYCWNGLFPHVRKKIINPLGERKKPSLMIFSCVYNIERSWYYISY